MSSGLVAYVFAVIMGVSTGLNLEEILIKSIFGFIVIFAGCFLLLYSLEKAQLKERERDKEIKEGEKEVISMDEETEEENDKEENIFSPLEISVVEVEEA